MRKILLAALAAGAASITGPAVAQNSGLVVVDLTANNVANNIAQDLDVNVSNIPVTVQVPIGIAANVCDVDANVLAQQMAREGEATCTAENNSTALNRIVQRQITQQ